MIYLLDTNAIVAGLASAQPFVGRLSRRSTSDFVLSSLVLHELYFGAYNGSRTNESLRNIARLRFAVIDFDHGDAKRAAEVRAMLKSRGTPIGPMDTLLAGQALARGLTLITRNLREFSRVDGLKLENWLD